MIIVLLSWKEDWAYAPMFSAAEAAAPVDAIAVSALVAVLSLLELRTLSSRRASKTLLERAGGGAGGSRLRNPRKSRWSAIASKKLTSALTI